MPCGRSSGRRLTMLMSPKVTASPVAAWIPSEVLVVAVGGFAAVAFTGAVGVPFGAAGAVGVLSGPVGAAGVLSCVVVPPVAVSCGGVVSSVAPEDGRTSHVHVNTANTMIPYRHIPCMKYLSAPE